MEAIGARDGDPFDGGATTHPTSIDATLVDAALACVAWDESVDVGRLLLLEHEHDLGLLRRAVARAGARLDEYDQSRSSEFLTHTRAVDLDIFSGRGNRHPESAAVLIHRHDGALWSIEDDEARMTDAQAASWMALCARHCSFSFEYDVQVDESDDGGPLDRRDTFEIRDHENMWLASVVRGLASRAGAWTGIEVMRTRNLCLALLAISGAREKGGPLAVVNLGKGDSLDQAVVPSPRVYRDDDDVVLASLGDALAQIERVRQLGFTFFAGYAGYRHLNMIDAAEHTRQVLSAIYAGVDRLYATEPYYVKMISPAEYEAIIVGAPLGAALLH